MTEKPSRRDALKFGAAAVGGLFIPKLLLSAIEIPDEPESPFSEETIQGIRVYGGIDPIKSREDLSKLIAHTEQESFHKLGHSASLGPDYDRGLLPENIRYWEFMLPKSDYDGFAQNDIGVDFVTWSNYHAEKTNEMLTSTKPEIPIRVSLKRIIVLDDKLYPTSHPYWRVNDDKDNFSRWAKDVDSRWAFNPGYYDYLYKDIDYYQQLLEFYGNEREIPIHGWNSVTETSEGKIAVLDWSLVHELIHHFNVGDLYWPPERLPKNKFGHLPARFRHFSFFSNDIMGGAGGTRSGKISPLTAYIINKRAEEGHRGVQPDGLRTEDPYLMFPKEARISLKANSKLNERLFEKLDEKVVRLDKVSVLASKKDIYEVDPEFLNGNSIKVDEEMSESGWNNWYLIIEGRYEGKEFSLPFPRHIFNLTSWQGEEKPRYKIHLTGNDNEFSYRLAVKTIYEDEFNAAGENLFAWAKIPSTKAYLVWEWPV